MTNLIELITCPYDSIEHAGSTTLINSGSVMVRNTAWARDFLSRWWTFANRTMFSDQEQFDMLYKQELDNDPLLRDKVVILQPDAINSDPPAMTQQKEHNQVLHLMVSYLLVLSSYGLWVNNRVNKPTLGSRRSNQASERSVVTSRLPPPLLHRAVRPEVIVQPLS